MVVFECVAHPKFFWVKGTTIHNIIQLRGKARQGQEYVIVDYMHLTCDIPELVDLA